MPENIQDELCYLGLTEIDGITKTFGILPDDRRRHMYIIGKSGVGKSTLLENIILQDIYAGKGICFIDPLGDSAEKILDKIPTYRHKDVIYLNPSDVEMPIGINMMEAQNDEPNYLIAAEMMSVFKKIWVGAWSGRMEYFLNNAILALLDVPGNNLIGISKMFTDKLFRKYISENCKNLMVKNFWQVEYLGYSDSYKNEAAGSIVNKINQFLANDMMRNIFGQQKSSINFREIMDKQQILIVNLSKGRIGEENARLFGGLLITKLQMAAMSRVNIPENERKDFYFCVDEFQNVISDSFATILSEARKYKLNLILAHQYMAQLIDTENTKVRDSVFGNVGTIITFQIGFDDAEYLERLFFPKSQKGESIPLFLGLDRGQILCKLFVQSKTIETFFANTIPPLYQEFKGHKTQVENISREVYGRNREKIEKEIEDYFTKSLITSDDGEEVRIKAPKRKRRKKPTLLENQNPENQNIDN
jgi:hypothetical protein